MDPKTRLDDDDKRVVPPAIKKLLAWDVEMTKKFVSFMLNFVAFRSLKVHCKFLEYSCHGIVWLAGLMAYIWIVNSKASYQMQVNLMFGLLLDIVIVAIIKAATRRRRPTMNDEMFTIGMDKFSFPSGHASRAFFLLLFFTWLSPVSIIFWSPLFAWSFSVGLSRLLLYRHHILDVVAGAILGILEALLLCILWLGSDTCNWIMNTISEDYVPGGPEDV
uniref:Phosphatidic acid phosphatase type 2/haloperoxidase domain-containing protein n=1 Tax=Megaselia scalaris TaxID=36166 RepID=T1GI00_MEGSC